MPYGFETGIGQNVVLGYQPVSTSLHSRSLRTLAGTATGVAPNWRMASMCAAGASSCVSTAHRNAARAEYAAAATPWLPVEAHTTRVLPSATAAEMATAWKRSLNEWVGFLPSYLSHTLAPSSRARSSGVSPSARLIGSCASLRTGSKPRQRQIPVVWRARSEWLSTDGSLSRIAAYATSRTPLRQAGQPPIASIGAC